MVRCTENAEHHCRSYPRCYGCSAFREATNADRIRSMTDEELAEFLCGVYQDETGKFINGITIIDYDECKILEWLRMPVEVDNG